MLVGQDEGLVKGEVKDDSELWESPEANSLHLNHLTVRPALKLHTIAHSQTGTTAIMGSGCNDQVPAEDLNTVLAAGEEDQAPVATDPAPPTERATNLRSPGMPAQAPTPKR